jgi:hypothetical protein
MFDNGVMSRILGPKREEVTGEWRKLHTEELHNLYFSENCIRVIISRIMIWAGYVEGIGCEAVNWIQLAGGPL